MFLPNVLITQRSIIWNPVHSMQTDHFEREEKHRNSINSESFPEYSPMCT